MPGRSFFWFILGLIAIVAGFWPSFFGNPQGNDGWHSVHGITATLWVLLLIAQSLLVGRRQWRWHEQLGWLSLGLFAVLCMTTGDMIRVELLGPEPFPAIVRQQLLFLDSVFLALFVALYALGLRFRRTPIMHARLMSSTILIGLAPSLVRLYVRYRPDLGLSGALTLAMATIVVILLAAIVMARRGGRSIRPFPELLAVFVAIWVGTIWSRGAGFAGLVRAAGAPV